MWSLSPCFALTDGGLQPPGMVVSRGDQDGLVGGWFAREDLKSQFLVPVEDVKRVVEIAADDDMLLGTREDVGTFQDLDKGRVQGDGVIVPEVPIGLEAEDLFELHGRIKGSVDIGEPVGGKRKAPVVSLHVGSLQESVGICDRGDPLPAQGLDETILLGSVGPFDSPLGLGTVGINDLDPQSSHSPEEVCHGTTVGIENGPPIKVKAPGEPVVLTVSPEGPHTVCGVLTGGKTHEGPARGIVDEMEERTVWATTLEPVVVGTVKLDELTNGGSTGSLGPMGSLPPLDVGAATGHEPTPYRLMVHENLVIFEQYLGKQGWSVVPVLRSPV